jgi:N-succinyldiaminopimelate aminotransferase
VPEIRSGACRTVEEQVGQRGAGWVTAAPGLVTAVRSDLLAAGLAQAGFGVFRTTGTYFITTGIRPLGESDGFAFCRALPERAGVVAIPDAVFYDHREEGAPFVRFAFCKRTGVLQEAVRRLKALAG